jgi:hypothetical protein
VNIAARGRNGLLSLPRATTVFRAYAKCIRRAILRRLQFRNSRLTGGFVLPKAFRLWPDPARSGSFQVRTHVFSPHGMDWGAKWDGDFTQIFSAAGDLFVNWNATNASPTPEPSTWMLFLTATAVVLILRFRKLAAMLSWPCSLVERRFTSKYSRRADFSLEATGQRTGKIPRHGL